MAQSLQEPMPKWLRRAMKLGVVSYQEVFTLQLLHAMEPPGETAVPPPWMKPACDRLKLLHRQEWGVA